MYALILSYGAHLYFSSEVRENSIIFIMVIISSLERRNLFVKLNGSVVPMKHMSWLCFCVELKDLYRVEATLRINTCIALHIQCTKKHISQHNINFASGHSIIFLLKYNFYCASNFKSKAFFKVIIIFLTSSSCPQ